MDTVKKTILKITKIELQHGSRFVKGWKEQMYVVNDKYLASTRDQDNIDHRPFDLQVGENVEVLIEKGKKTPDWEWICRA